MGDGQHGSGTGCTGELAGPADIAAADAYLSDRWLARKQAVAMAKRLADTAGIKAAYGDDPRSVTAALDAIRLFAELAGVGGESAQAQADVRVTFPKAIIPHA